MKTYFVLGFTIVLLLACHKPTEGSQTTDQELVQLIIELHLMEAKIEKEKWHLRDTLRHMSLSRLAALHHKTVEQLKTDINNLQLDPDKAHRIYKSVTKELKALEQNTKKKNEHKK